MRNEMTRYSKDPDKLNRKNTLVTIQEGDMIYFGIARCNRSAGDTFIKNKGRTAAKARAIRAKIEFSREPVLDAARAARGPSSDRSLITHFNGLRGAVEVSHIHELLDYFRNIDNIRREAALSD